MSKNRILKKPEAPEAPIAVDSKTERARREAHVENYAKTNPVKYAQKKDSLDKWINEA